MQLSRIWPWLPQFRVVAEFENLGKASRKFGVTTAALSKAIKQLESKLGYAVFERVGGKLRLNSRGSELLAVVRLAMRDIDDVIANDSKNHARPLRVACQPCWVTVLGLGKSQREIEWLPLPSNAKRALLRGELDVVIDAGILPVDAELTSVLLREVPLQWFAATASGQKSSPVAAKSAASESASPTLTGFDISLALLQSGGAPAILPVEIGKRYSLTPLLEPAVPAISLFALARKARPHTENMVGPWLTEIVEGKLG